MAGLNVSLLRAVGTVFLFLSLLVLVRSQQPVDGESLSLGRCMFLTFSNIKQCCLFVPMGDSPCLVVQPLRNSRVIKTRLPYWTASSKTLMILH